MSNIFCGLIPSDILQDKRLTQTEKLLMGVFLGFHFNKLSCTASNSTLGFSLGISSSGVRTSIYKLKELGLVNVEIKHQTFRTITCNYEQEVLQTLLTSDQGVLVHDQGGCYQISRGGASTVAGGVLVHDHQINNIINNIKKKNKTLEDAKASPSKEVVKTSKEITTHKNPKSSIFTKESIPQEDLFKILQDPTLANNDRDYLKEQIRTMADWSASGHKRKINWTATLRNWIRRSRQNGFLPNGVAQKSKVKTFTELEHDWAREQREAFLREKD